MYDHTAFIANLHHWIIFDRRGKCDEGADEAFSKGDFWKILFADVVLIYHTMSTSANFE